MKQSISLLLTLGLLIGTAFSGSPLTAQDSEQAARNPKFVGTWVLDSAKMLEMNEASIASMLPDGVPPEMAEQVKAQISQSFKSMKLEIVLSADGKARGAAMMPAMAPGAEGEMDNSIGTWSSDGDTVSISLKGDDDEAPEMQNGRLENGLLILEIETGPMKLKLPLKRRDASFAGKWQLDQSRVVAMNQKAFAKLVPEGVPAEMREAVMEQIAQAFSQLEVTMVLSKDGTVTGTFTSPAMGPGMEAETTESTGTWKANGSTASISMKDPETGEMETETATMEGGLMILNVNENGMELRLPMKRVVAAGPPGSWSLDNEMMIEMNLETMLPPGAPPEAASMVKQMLGQMTFVLTLSEDGKANGVATNPMAEQMGQDPEQRVTGTWKKDGDKILVTMKSDDEEEPQTASGKIEGDRLVLSLTQGGRTVRMPFKRN